MPFDPDDQQHSFQFPQIVVLVQPSCEKKGGKLLFFFKRRGAAVAGMRQTELLSV
jgi:hypothetical protein